MDWFGLAILAVGFVGIALLGIPLVSRLADRQLHPDRPMDTYDPTRRADAVAGQGFTPLELGPDPLSWPSEVGGRKPYREQLAWPSSHWDDDAFGRADATAAGEAARARAEAVRAAARDKRRREVASQAPAVPSRRARAEAVPPPAAAPPSSGRATLTLKRRPSVPSGPPTGAELARMVRKLGLAKTVQKLMAEHDLSIDEVTELITRAR